MEANVEGFAPSMAGRAIDLFVLDAQRCRIVFNATASEDDQTELEVRFGERVTEGGIDLVVRLTTRSPATRPASKRGQTALPHSGEDPWHAHWPVPWRLANDQRGAHERHYHDLHDVFPDRAKRFLDTLAATYIDYTAEARLATNVQTERFINEQLQEINALTDTLERQVDYYRAQNEVLDLTREQNEYFNTLVDLERQLREMDVQAESLDDLGIFLSSRDGNAELPLLLLHVGRPVDG